MLFQLGYEALLQGSFEPKEKNIAYIFQVNCPGCFIYGFPLINAWYKQHSRNVGFIGISTYFEDFELNTLEHTKQFLNSGTMVGETLHYFSAKNIKSFPDIPEFPIVYDATIPSSDFLTEENIISIGNTLPGYQHATVEQQKAIQHSIKDYYDNLSKMAFTFTSNQLRGTPSYVMFDKNFKIINSFFGNLPSTELEFYF